MTTGNDGMRRKDGQVEAGLDDLFTAARSARSAPSEALMARVLADALAEQPRMAMQAPGPRLRGPGLWARLVWALGGTGALAGMGTAAVAGLFLGLVQPVGLAGLDEAVLGAPLETVELIPGIDGLLEGN